MMKLLSLRRYYGGVLLVMFLICSLAAGCGGGPKGIVTGKISYKGNPLKSGTVTFTPENAPAVSGPIDSEGTYRVEKIPLGMAKISVSAGSSMNSDAIAKVNDPRKPEQMYSAFKSKSGTFLPKEYSNPDQSGLSFDVKKGPQEHNIDLK